MAGSSLKEPRSDRYGVRARIPGAVASTAFLSGRIRLLHRKPACVRGDPSASIARACLLVLVALRFFSSQAFAQESPYIVTYDHHLEEPGNLEVEYFSTFGTQRAGNDFHSYWIEFEYGATAWWTTEFYLDGQTTFQDSTLFTGFRWENRFRPLRNEHFVNPVIYVEYENI